MRDEAENNGKCEICHDKKGFEATRGIHKRMVPCISCDPKAYIADAGNIFGVPEVQPESQDREEYEEDTQLLPRVCDLEHVSGYALSDLGRLIASHALTRESAKKVARGLLACLPEVHRQEFQDYPGLADYLR